MNNEPQIITKLKFFLDLEKEVSYINEMNNKGWKLVFIKLGMCYTFVKSNPNEYFTILHAASKDTISSLSTLATQCGYESIPHTCDGLGDFLYLTGKKNEVTESFVSDNESKAVLYKKFQSRYRNFFILYTIASAFILTPIIMSAGYILLIASNLHRLTEDALLSFKINTVIITTFGIIGLLIAITAIYLLFLSIRYKKRYRSVCNDMKVFE